MDLTNGETVSPVIASLFVDENGLFSNARLVDFLRNVEEGDENAKAIWAYLQEQIVTNQFFNKYNALFMNSNVENALQVNKAIADNNTTADVDFVWTSSWFPSPTPPTAPSW